MVVENIDFFMHFMIYDCESYKMYSIYVHALAPSLHTYTCIFILIMSLH